MSIRDHLLSCSADYAERAVNPRVAWDCLGADTWAKACADIAADIENMDDGEALAHLAQLRQRALSSDGSDGLSCYVAMDTVKQLDRIIGSISATQAPA